MCASSIRQTDRNRVIIIRACSLVASRRPKVGPNEGSNVFVVRLNSFFVSGLYILPVGTVMEVQPRGSQNVV